MLEEFFVSFTLLFKRIFPSAKIAMKRIGLFFLAILFLLCSGNASFDLDFSSKEKITVYLIVAAVIITLFGLSIDVNKVKILKNNKTLFFKSYSFVYVVIFLIGIIVSFLANSEKSKNINPYIQICFILIISFLITKIWSFTFFSKFFDYLVLSISFVSLICYFFVVCSGFNFSTSYFYNNNSYSNYWGLLYVFSTYFYSSLSSYRLMSVFWEPGVYGTFLLFAIIVEILFKKTNWWHVFFLLFCLLLTESTAALILLFFVLLILIWRKTKGMKNKLALYFGFLFFLLCCLIFYQPLLSFLSYVFPSIFGKIEFETSSLTTRLLSPYYYFRVFLGNPFFGYGQVSANELYFSIAPSTSVDARTSTSGLMIASYGIVGFLFTCCPAIGIFFKKNLSIFEKIPLLIVFLAVINKEGDSGILLLNIIYMYFCSFVDERINEKIIYVGEKTTVSNVLSKRNDAKLVSSNIYWSFILKGAAIIVGFFTLPIYGLYFGDDSSYGVWLTIYSLLSWIVIFDFGMGNGMKNKLIIAISKGDEKDERRLISSTYFSTIIIGIFIELICVMFIWFFNVNSFFNIDSSILSALTLRISLTIVISSICVQFVLRNITYIFQAKRQNALANSFSLITNSAMLIIVLLFQKTLYDKFIFLSTVFGICLNLPLIIATLIFFIFIDKKLKPSFAFFSFQTAKDVISIGGNFFVIQLCNIVLTLSNSLLISYFFGPSYVVEYTEYYKLFGTISGLVTVYETTIWTEATKCLTEHKFSSLKKLFKVSYLLGIILSFFSIVAFLGVQIIFDLWLNSVGGLTADYFIAGCFVFYNVAFIFSETGVIFSNAFSKLKSQLFIFIPAAIVKIPFLFLYCSYFGNPSWVSIIIFTSIYLLISAIIIPVAMMKYISKESKKYPKEKAKEVSDFSKVGIIKKDVHLIKI